MTQDTKVGYWRSEENPRYSPPAPHYGVAYGTRVDGSRGQLSARDEAAIARRRFARDAALPWPVAGMVDATRLAVADALDAAPVVASFRGWSNCRICGKPNGSRERATHGYRWPEGLSHYVREHGVVLPPEFEATLLGNVESPPATVPCLVSHPDVGDGQHWTAEAIDEVDAAALGERIVAWARENPDSQIVIRSRMIERSRYEAAGEKAGV